ncbi:hypothetical protein DSO57_1002880 [Entomophthora muscae]|uniref:Uncharacterized protein n=1 Tax=Entomophthora muscae TaxID=34485 RepID=A0ACC2TWE2_9FUNG|nr:hypothetical protein DSO57_1002880 [Entomophthora muscae]
MSSILSCACSKGTQLILFPIRCVYSMWVFPIKIVYGLFTSLFSPTPAPSQLLTGPKPTIHSNAVPPTEYKPLATPPVHPIFCGPKPTLHSNAVPPTEYKPLATSPVYTFCCGPKPTLCSKIVPPTKYKPLATSPAHPICCDPKPTPHSNTAPHKRCKLSATSSVHSTRRKVLRRSIGTKTKIEQALAHEDAPMFVSLLNLALRSYIKELSRLSLEELYEEFQISFYMNPPPNCRISPKPFLLAMGMSKSNLSDYRVIMMAQMTSHALGLCRISPQDAYMFRQPKHSEGFSAKISLDLVVKKLGFLQSRSLADSGKLWL